MTMPTQTPIPNGDSNDNTRMLVYMAEQFSTLTAEMRAIKEAVSVINDVKTELTTAKVELKEARSEIAELKSNDREKEKAIQELKHRQVYFSVAISVGVFILSLVGGRLLEIWLP